MLVKHIDGRAYLHGIIDSESHFVDSDFSYVEISPSLIETLQTDMKTLTVTRCSEDQLKCPSGICLNKILVCDGKPDCKDGWDEKSCQPILFPKTAKGFQDIETKFKEIEVSNWKMKEEILRMKEENVHLKDIIGKSSDG